MTGKIFALAAGLLICAGARANDAVPAAETKPAPVKRGVRTAKEIPNEYFFAKPVILRGVLGEQRIQVHVRPKADIMEGVEGEYFVFGESKKILLAGDLSRQRLVLEESQDGKKVSGHWEGVQEGDTLRGIWTSADDKVLPFVLTKVSDKPAPRKPAIVPAAHTAAPGPAQAAVPAAPAAAPAPAR